MTVLACPRTDADMNFDLLIDLHQNNYRQGPGSDEHTLLAMTIARLQDRQDRLTIADIGCGTGSQTLVLAKHLNADIYAVDLFPEFLSVLDEKAIQSDLKSTIHSIACSMDDLDFAPESLDVLWSEGALYNMGFGQAIAYQQPFLKKGGLMACSEVTWLTQERPKVLEDHWQAEYAEMGDAGDKIQVLSQHGLNLVGYFTLDETCWMDNYFIPLQDSFEAFLARHNHSKEARQLVASEQQEIALYEENARYISYGFYIARKE